MGHVFFGGGKFCWQRRSGGIGVVTLTKVKHRRELSSPHCPRYSRFISSPKDLSGWDWMEFFRLR